MMSKVRRVTVILPLLALVLGVHSAWGVPYPCPSDPGFCYRDLGNDGCFDVGPDTGPINADIETSNGCPPAVPGSIVCPPSVTTLTAASSTICVSTDPGSSILLYAAEIRGVSATFDSGDEILFGGGSYRCSVDLVGVGDILVEKGIRGRVVTGALRADSTGGNVTLDSRVRASGEQMLIRAAAGVTLHKSVSLRASREILITAGGTIEMTRPKLKTDPGTSHVLVDIQGSEIVMHEAASIRMSPDPTAELEITATAGDLTIDRLTLKTNHPTTISGTNITIGVMQNGTVPRSSMSMYAVPIEVLATDEIHIENLRLRSAGNVVIETDGTVADVLNSDLVGTPTNMPTFFVTANGVGSTCNVTGTEVTKATLVTNCDSVIGP